MHNIALPSLETTEKIFESTSIRLWKSLSYILKCTDQMDSNFGQLVDRFHQASKAPPFFFAAHEILKGYFCEDRRFPQELVNALLNIEEYTAYERLEILPFCREPGTQERMYKEAIFSDLRNTYTNVDTNKALPQPVNRNGDAFISSKYLMNKAIEILRQADQELFSETEYVVNEIRLFDSNYLRAGTNFNTLGLIYVGTLSADDDVSRYIEHIVHESAHNVLYAHWTTDPIFHNHTDQLFYTPFRKDHRPLSAIFHAMFVLCRTLYAFNTISIHTPEALDFRSIRTNYNEQGNATPFTEKFAQTSEVIHKEADLTDYGKSIFDSCVSLVNNCRLSL